MRHILSPSLRRAGAHLLRRCLAALLFSGMGVLAQAPGAREAAPADPAAEAEKLLRQLAANYYDLGEAGLARAACLVQSRDILEQFDDTARRVLSGAKYEAIFVPGKPVAVHALDVPKDYGMDARNAVTAYSVAAGLVLNGIQGFLQAVPTALDPNRLFVRATIAVKREGGNGENRRLIIQSLERLPAARNRKPGAPENETTEIVLDRKGNILSLKRITAKGSEVIGVTTESWDGKWAIRSLDIAKYDEQDRLFERTIIAIQYVRVKGLLLPAKVSSKAVNKDGELLRRRSEPNPVAIQFSRYKVDARE